MLKPYKGRLDAAEVAAGMNAALRNAARLADDAEILLSASRYPSAASLAVLSIEESGKVSSLRHLAVAQTQEEVIRVWREYRSHTKKNAAWILPQLISTGARTLEDLRPLFDPASDHPQVIDAVKQIGFYSDCLGNAHWSEPEEVIDEQLARNLVRTAKLFSKHRNITPQEIELWIEYIGPVWNKPMEWMKVALAKWHDAMTASGYATGEMNAFLGFAQDTN